MPCACKVLVTTAAAFFVVVGIGHAEGPRLENASVAGVNTKTTGPSTSNKFPTTPVSFDSATLHQIRDGHIKSQRLGVTVSQLEDMNIYGAGGKKVGEVDHVLGDSADAIRAVTVGVGGFLGIGARELIIPIDQLAKATEEDRLQAAMTREEVDELSEWKEPARDIRGRPAN